MAELSKYWSTEPDAGENLSPTELATELAAGFTPGIGTAQAVRDYLRASKKEPSLQKYIDMGLSALGTVPVAGGAAKAMLLAPYMLRKSKNAAKNVDALATHTVSAAKLLQHGTPQELYNPSFAVHSKKGFEPWGLGSNDTMFVHKPGTLDPRSSPTTLYSGDAMTVAPSYGAGAPTWDLASRGYLPQPQGRALAKGRLQDRANYRDAPFDADWGPKKFDSLEHYLADPKGYDALNLPFDQKSASDYGELKALGPVQVRPNNFAGVITESDAASKKFVEMLRARQIPHERVDSFENTDELYELANWLQRRSLR